MHEVVGKLITDLGGWELAREVSFSIYGERGVIDILAWHSITRTLLVIELKTAIVDANEIAGTMDRRRRLAGRIAEERGWSPDTVAVWVAVADTRTNRRRLAEHVGLLRGAFPADGRSVRRWLAAPAGAIAALSFLPVAGISSGTHPFGVRKRVRRPSPRTTRAARPRIGVTFHG